MKRELRSLENLEVPSLPESERDIEKFQTMIVEAQVTGAQFLRFPDTLDDCKIFFYDVKHEHISITDPGGILVDINTWTII